MKKEVASRFFVFLAFQSLCISSALSQTPPLPANPTTPPVTETCPIPYIIGETLKGGELEARFASNALAKLAKMPNIGARGGYEVVKTAYAGVSSQAMASVFDAYGCRIKRYMKANATIDAAEKSRAVDKAVAWLSFELSQIQVASEQGADAIKEMKVDYMNTEIRSDRAPVLDSSITIAALADVDPNKLFIDKSEVKKWLSLDIGTYAKVSACGGIVKAALSDGGSSLQRALANAKSILINYLDPSQPPYIALGALLNSASVAPQKRDSYPSTVTFKGCTDGVLKEQESNLNTALKSPTNNVAPPITNVPPNPANNP